MTDEQIIEAARARYASENVEIDSDASLSQTDAGTWVAAWVWVPAPATDGAGEKEA